jgi:hypothetical protein
VLLQPSVLSAKRQCSTLHFPAPQPGHAEFYVMKLTT